MKDQIATIENLKDMLRIFYAERQWSKHHKPKDVAMALSIEAAELLELFLWKSPEHIAERMEKDADFRQKVESELADVFAYTLNFALATNIDLSAALEQKMVKNREKYPVQEGGVEAPDKSA